MECSKQIEFCNQNILIDGIFSKFNQRLLFESRNILLSYSKVFSQPNLITYIQEKDFSDSIQFFSECIFFIFLLQSIC